MLICAGCNREATLKVNHSVLAVCIPCSKLLPGLPTARVGARAAICCGCRDTQLWHGEQVCWQCRWQIGQWLWKAGGDSLDLLTDNPFFYEICVAYIRFCQTTLNYDESEKADALPADENYIWFNPNNDNTFKQVKFDRLVYKNQNSS